MKIIGTGLSGLVGSRVVELLSPAYTFQNLSLETGVDITKKDDITRIISDDNLSPWILHLAAYTDVQGAEKERGLGVNSKAWMVNVIATKYIVDVCKATGKRLLYVDTDYAFDGKQKMYKEDDIPSPQGWYAVSKSEGAKHVLEYDKGLVIRISNPYRAHPVGKTDFVHKILDRFIRGENVVAPTDQLFVPTFVDDIASAIHTLISVQATGMYHVTPTIPISPYDAALTVAKTYGCDTSLVGKTTFAEYFAGRAPAPQFAVLSNDKISGLGVTLHEFVNGIHEIHRQESGLK